MSPSSSDPLFQAVFELGESQKSLVGMLPLQAWREYADEGRILAAVEQNPDHPDTPRVVGYAAYRLPRQEVVLAHLVVHPGARGQRIARLLVEHISEKYESRRGILAKCRRDYEASKAWPGLGFIAQGDLPGRGFGGERLTVWWRDHGHPDLMTWPGAPASVTSIVIDTNVFLDLHSETAGEDRIRTRELLTSTLEGRIQLLVTPELGNEINRHEHAAERAKLQSIRLSYPAIQADPASISAFRATIEAELDAPPTSARDVSDLLHVAYAAAAGVDIVVTRDDKALRKLRVVAREFVGVSLVSPQELVALLDEMEGSPAYSPSALLGTGYHMREAGIDDQSCLDSFLDTSAGEKRRDYTKRTRSLAEHRPIGAHRLLVTEPGADAVALLGSDVVRGVLEISLLRMKPFPLATTMAAQLVSRLRPLARDAGVSAIRVTDPHPNPLLNQALLADGFGAAASGTVGLAIAEVRAIDEVATTIRAAAASLDDIEQQALSGLVELADTIRSDSSPVHAAALERQARPLRIADAALETWLVPIKPAWSSQLFGVPADMFGQTPELGISVEHVYYRRGHSGETAPARVLWYVSGRHNMAVIGCSELVEVKDGNPRNLHREFRRLGVYGWKEVQAAADKRGNVRALRVTNTELFATPVTLRRLTEMAGQERQTLQLVSPRRISASLFARIMREARA